MAFGIIRVRNLKMGDLASTDKHNARLYKDEKEYPENINPDGYFNARYFKEETDWLSEDGEFIGTLKGAVQDELRGVTGLRSNSNVAIEFVVSVSDKKAWNRYEPSGFFSEASKFIESKYGNIVAQYEHLDESNPHVHFVVVPTETKIIKWKNKQGSGEREEKRLNSRDITGGPLKLRKLQDDYHKWLIDNNWGQKMGVEFYRGTKVENQTKEYLQRTSHEIAELNTKLASINDDLERKRVELQILEKNALMASKELELQKQIEKKRAEGEKWKKKGSGELKEPFHGDKKKGLGL